MRRAVARPGGRPDDTSGRLHERAETYVRSYLSGSVDREGRAAMGVAVEGALAGVYRFLVDEVGREAAFNTMQRAADAVIQERAQPPPA